MITIEQWTQTVSKELQVVKGLVDDKPFTTAHIIFNAPNKEIVCVDGARFKLGTRASLPVVKISKLKPAKKISTHPTLF